MQVRVLLGAPPDRQTSTIRGVQTPRAWLVALVLVALGLSATPTAAPAPATYRVRLDTTKGAIVIECVRAWAPRGADRFYELVTSGWQGPVLAVERVPMDQASNYGVIAPNLSKDLGNGVYEVLDLVEKPPRAHPPNAAPPSPNSPPIIAWFCCCWFWPRRAGSCSRSRPSTSTSE